MTAKERTQAKRIQTSVLNAGEKKILVWIAKRMPRWVTSDMLTGIGLFGALVFALGFYLSNFNIQYLWIANLGLLLNWYGDSLDGSLARVRNTQRPIYGFFVDHNVDGVTMAIMCVGAGLAYFVNMYVSLSVLTVYLLLSIYVYISAHLKNEFKLTYGKMGPTEFRAIIFIINILFMYVAPIREGAKAFIVIGRRLTFTFYDLFLIIIFVALLVIYLNSIVADAKKYAIEDPLPKRKD